MEDIAPALLKSIQKDFQKRFDKSEKIASLYSRVRDGTATYVEAHEYAIEVGEILANTFQDNLLASQLPDGRLYYNIAQRIIEPMLGNNYDMITDVTQQIQTTLNRNAGIHIKAIKPQLNQDRVKGIIDKVSNSQNFDEVSWMLDEPVKNFSQSVVDDSIRENAKFQAKAGLNPIIVRRVSGNCCKWCKSLAGTYAYEDTPKDIYRRHARCRCVVDYNPGSGKVQNAHTKRWRDEEELEKIEFRKTVGLKNQTNANSIKDIANSSKSDIMELADINKMFTSYERATLNSIPHKDGYFDVAAHGAAENIWYGSIDKKISARELANIIKHTETYHGEKIRLLSCSTGSAKNGFAQQLANALGVEVEAPSDKLYVMPNGKYWIGRKGDGKMIIFKPGKEEL